MIDDILNIFSNAPTIAKIAIVVFVALIIASAMTDKKSK